jgi:hypothetical protein
MVNFLFDSSQTPHIAASQIWEYFELSSSTMQAKSKQIRDLMGMYPMDPDWSIPSMVDKNPLIWMRRQSMGSSSMCATHKGEIQEVAFRKGLIPYIPDA